MEILWKGEKSEVEGNVNICHSLSTIWVCHPPTHIELPTVYTLHGESQMFAFAHCVSLNSVYIISTRYWPSYLGFFCGKDIDIDIWYWSLPLPMLLVSSSVYTVSTNGDARIWEAHKYHSLPWRWAQTWLMMFWASFKRGTNMRRLKLCSSLQFYTMLDWWQL